MPYDYVPTRDIAQMIMEQGRQRAENARANAAIWQQGLAGVSQSLADASRQKFEAAKAARQQAMADAQAAQEQRKQQDQDVSDKALGSLGTNPTDDAINGIAQQLPGHLRMGFLKQAQEFQGLAQKHREQQNELFARGAAAALTASKGNPQAGEAAWQGLLAHSKEMGYDTSQYEQIQDPSQREAMLSGAIQSSPTVAKEWNDAEEKRAKANAPVTLAPGASLVNPQTGQVVASGGAAPMTDFQKAELGLRSREVALKEGEAARKNAPGLGGDIGTGDEALKGLSSAEAQLVKDVADYKIDPTKATSMRGDARQKLIERANAYAAGRGESYDMTQFGVRSKTRQDFTTGKAAQNIKSLNTAISHLDELSKAGDELGNTRFPLLNASLNKFKAGVGSDSVTKYNTAAEAVSGELGKVFKDQATDAEIKAWHDKLASSQSPQQLKSNIQEIIKLMGGRMSALKDQYQTAMGKPANFHLLNAKSKEILSGLGANLEDLGEGGDAPSMDEALSGKSGSGGSEKKNPFR